MPDLIFYYFFAALRKTMLRAHRQAWAWQDEWYGLTMNDIRELERQTQLALHKKMGIETGSNDGEQGCDRNPNFLQIQYFQKSSIFFFLQIKIF